MLASILVPVLASSVLLATKRGLTTAYSAGSGRTAYTVPRLLDLATKKLKSNDISEARLSAVHLLTKALNLDGRDFNLVMRSSENEYSGREVSEEEREGFDSFVARRMKCEPIQYIVGSWDFHDLPLPLLVRQVREN